MKNTVKIILLSTATITAGYFAMALPFKLFNTLSQTQMRIILAAEIIIYFSLFAVFYLKKEQNAKRKKKDAEAKNRRKKRIENYQSALKELSVTDYEHAA